MPTSRQASDDGNETAGHYAVASAVLDGHEIPNYVIVYRPETPLQVIAVLNGKRNMKKVLEERREGPA